MSIRSVDMMILISKIADVEKMHQQQQEGPKVAQENLAAQETRRKNIEKNKTPETNQDEETGKIVEHPERKRKNKNSMRGDDSSEESLEEGEGSTASKKNIPPLSGAIDITI